MPSDYEKHPQRDFVQAALSSDYFDDTHPIQYGFGVLKGSWWIVFHDPSKEKLEFAFHPEFSRKHSTKIASYSESGPRTVSSAGLNKLGNKGEHPNSNEAFGELWSFETVGRFLDCVKSLEDIGAFS